MLYSLRLVSFPSVYKLWKIRVYRENVSFCCFSAEIPAGNRKFTVENYVANFTTYLNSTGHLTHFCVVTKHVLSKKCIMCMLGLILDVILPIPVHFTELKWGVQYSWMVGLPNWYFYIYCLGGWYAHSHWSYIPAGKDFHHQRSIGSKYWT